MLLERRSPGSSPRTRMQPPSKARFSSTFAGRSTASATASSLAHCTSRARCSNGGLTRRALGTIRTSLATETRSSATRAGVDPSFRPWHGLRHTALTETAAAGVPAMFVQAKAGHTQGSTTERYLHAARTSYPDAAELAEARLFGSEVPSSVPNSSSDSLLRDESPAGAGLSE